MLKYIRMREKGFIPAIKKIYLVETKASSLAKGYDSGPLLSTLGRSRIHFEIRSQCHLVVYRSCAP
jgi:hypothetical protein